MSYILDALKRADAERQREQGGPPDLLSPAAPLGLAEADEPAPVAQRWLWPAAALLLGAALAWGAALWWRTEPAQAAQPHAPGPEPAATPRAAAPPAAPVAPPVPPPRMADAPPLPAARPQLATTSAALPAALPAAAPTAVASSPAPVPSPSAAPASTRLPKLAELPAALRQGLPALSVGGSTHSEVAAQRLLILNGAVLHEGDEAAPALVLERIRPRSAVLRWQGQRFEIDF